MFELNSLRRAVLSTLRAVLNRCDSVPKLLASTDMYLSTTLSLSFFRLEKYVLQATSLGLGKSPKFLP